MGICTRRFRSGVSAGRHHHQAQDRMHFATFDVTTRARPIWSPPDGVDAHGERMTRGEAFRDGAVGLNPYAPPSDTGEHWGCPPPS
jgi:deferrochelatase/peroxidase EfeB